MADAVLRTADARAEDRPVAPPRRHVVGGARGRRRPEIGTATRPTAPRGPTSPSFSIPATCRAGAPAARRGRRAILHAVAHIELNAVDLHWDVIARFAHVPMPIGFFDDWVRAADEESKHFNLWRTFLM
jgi:uncharacterized ferritin-like protein (DUF455 family)